MAGMLRRPFAARLHLALIVLMLASFLLIAQRWSKLLFQVGLGVLVCSALVQVVFGNVSPEAGLVSSLRQLALGLVVVAAVFALGVVLTPVLVNLGR